MSIITLQTAGEFLECDRKVYYADNFNMYFYRNEVSDESPENVTNSFHFITDEEIKNHKTLYGEFLLYEGKADIVLTTYQLGDTNIKIPVELIEEHILKLTSMYEISAQIGKNTIDEMFTNIPNNNCSSSKIDKSIQMPDDQHTTDIMENLEKLTQDISVSSNLMQFKNQLYISENNNKDEIENIIL